MLLSRAVFFTCLQYISLLINVQALIFENQRKATAFVLSRDSTMLKPSSIHYCGNDKIDRRKGEYQRLLKRYLPPSEVEEFLQEVETANRDMRTDIASYRALLADPQTLPRHVRRRLPALRRSIENKLEHSGEALKGMSLLHGLRGRMPQELVTLQQQGRREEAMRVREAYVEFERLAVENNNAMMHTLDELRRREA